MLLLFKSLETSNFSILTPTHSEMNTLRVRISDGDNQDTTKIMNLVIHNSQSTEEPGDRCFSQNKC